MGWTSENVAGDFNVTREEMDTYAALSFQRAEKAGKEVQAANRKLLLRIRLYVRLDVWPRVDSCAGCRQISSSRRRRTRTGQHWRRSERRTAI